MARKTILSISLDSEADKDILRWVDSLDKGEKSAGIRDAIRAHIGGGGVTLGDIFQAVKDLERKVQSGVVIHQASGDDLDDAEPAEAVAALDALMNL